MKKEEIRINLKELRVEMERNRIERLKFVKFLADYVKKTSDEDWSEQQNIIINSQFK